MPQSGAEQNFYCNVNSITFNSNCEAQRASKSLKKIVEDISKKPKIMHECRFSTFEGEKCI